MSFIHKLFNYLTDKIIIDLKSLRTRLFLFLFNLLPDFYILSPLRNFILYLGGAKVSILHSYIRSPFWCTELKGLCAGKGVFINMGCRFEGTASIIIGDRCQIGPFCCFENVNHIEGEDQFLPILISNDVWIGAKAVIVPGINIGNNSIIAAGAVVTKKIPSFELWGGVPAKKIKQLDINNIP